MLFVLGAEDALRHITAPAGLRARIPVRPPAHPDVDAEGQQRHPGRVDVGNKREDRSGAALAALPRRVNHGELLFHRVNAADRAYRVVRQHDHHAHLEDELHNVRPEDAPETGNCGVKTSHPHQRDADDDGPRFGNSEGCAENLFHREVHPSHHQAVHQDAEIQRAKASQECRGSSGVTQLDELSVRDGLGAPPQPGKEEHGHHAAQQKAPPQPVGRNPVPRHLAGHPERRIGGEGCGHHRGPREPPRDLAPGNKKLAGARAGLLAVVEPDQQIDEEIKAHDQPVHPSQLHETPGPKYASLTEAAREYIAKDSRQESRALCGGGDKGKR